jgi:hypothetical protein
MSTRPCTGAPAPEGRVVCLFRSDLNRSSNAKVDRIMTKQEVIKYYMDERDRVQAALSRATAGGDLAEEEIAEFRSDLEDDLRHANEMVEYWQSE